MLHQKKRICLAIFDGDSIRRRRRSPLSSIKSNPLSVFEAVFGLPLPEILNYWIVSTVDQTDIIDFLGLVVWECAALRACGSTVFILNSLNRLRYNTTVHWLNKYKKNKPDVPKHHPATCINSRTLIPTPASTATSPSPNIMGTERWGVST